MAYVVNKACVENKEKHFADLQSPSLRGGFARYGPLTILKHRSTADHLRGNTVMFFFLFYSFFWSNL